MFKVWTWVLTILQGQLSALKERIIRWWFENSWLKEEEDDSNDELHKKCEKALRHICNRRSLRLSAKVFSIRCEHFNTWLLKADKELKISNDTIHKRYTCNFCSRYWSQMLVQHDSRCDYILSKLTELRHY